MEDLAAAKRALDEATPPPARPQSMPELPVSAAADDSTWIYVEETETRADKLKWESHRIFVSRGVIVTQGILLGLVGISGFVLGCLWHERVDRDSHEITAVEEAAIFGTIHFHSSRSVLPDDNAAVIVVPATRQPESRNRPDIAGLRPDDPYPLPDSELLTVLQLLGGGYERTATDGTYHLDLPNGGRYFVLVLSDHVQRDVAHELSKSDLAQIGRYFLPVTELLQDRKYDWRQIEIDGDTRHDVTF